MRDFSISAVAINSAALAKTMQEGSAGAFVQFEGWVRNHNEGKPVRGLQYEVFTPLALSEGKKILDESCARFSLLGARAVHREGALAIGDCAVWIGTTAPHRDDAFAGCRMVIDALKHRLPIWKKETYADGTAALVNCHDHAGRGHLPHYPRVAS